MLLHHSQELDDDLRGRSDQDLALPALLCIADGVERVVQHTDEHHLCKGMCEPTET